MAGRRGTGTPQRPATVVPGPFRVVGRAAPNTLAGVRLDLTPGAVSLCRWQFATFPIRKATTMAPSSTTGTSISSYLDGVIDTALSLFACRVPDSEAHPQAFVLADRLMDVAKHDPELAVRVALSRALEAATGTYANISREYLQAAVVIIHSYGHPTHRKA